jgi:nucleotide-binding universal stress UspA family protein
MNILVGYDGSDLAKKALEVGREHARVFDAKLYVMHSILLDWPKEEYEEQQKELEIIQRDMENENLSCETLLKISSQTPGEHLVQFTKENNIDEVIIGVKMRSRVGKLLMGSVAQYVILNAPCIVVTVK